MKYLKMHFVPHFQVLHFLVLRFQPPPTVLDCRLLRMLAILAFAASVRFL